MCLNCLQSNIYIYYIYIYAHTRTHMIDIGLFNLMAIWLYIYMACRTSKKTYFYIHTYLSLCHCVHPRSCQGQFAVLTEVVEMDLLHDLVILGATVEPEETSHGNSAG